MEAKYCIGPCGGGPITDKDVIGLEWSRVMYCPYCGEELSEYTFPETPKESQGGSECQSMK